MPEESILDVLKPFVFILIHDNDETDEYRTLSKYIDASSTCCIDLSTSPALHSELQSQFAFTRLPALIYRGTPVYCSDHVETDLDRVDRSNIDRINQFLDSFLLKEGVTLFIKGTIEKPYCKYTKQLLLLLSEQRITSLKDFDILADDEMRYYLKEINSHATFPMIYINGRFVGGLDSFKELIASGKLDSN